MRTLTALALSVLCAAPVYARSHVKGKVAKPAVTDSGTTENKGESKETKPMTDKKVKKIGKRVHKKAETKPAETKSVEQPTK